MVGDKFFLQLAFAHARTCALFSHTCGDISPMISSLIRNRKQNTRIYRRAVYAGVFFFYSLFRFFNCYSPRRDIIPSPACVRSDISRMERLHHFFLFFSPPLPNHYNRRARRRFTLEPLERLFRNSRRPDLHVRTANLSGARVPRTFITRHFLRRHVYQLFYRALLLPLLGPIIPHDCSAEFAILSAFLRVRRNKSVCCFLISSAA